MANCMFVKSVWVLGLKPNGSEFPVHDAQCIKVVTGVEIQHLIDVLSEQPSFAAYRRDFQDFINDLSFNDNPDRVVKTPTHALSLSQEDLTIFAEKCRVGGISGLGLDILEKWLPLGVDRLLLSCRNTLFYY